MASLRRMVRRWKGHFACWRDYVAFSPMARDAPGWQHIRWKPQPEDRFADAGTMRGAYFHQDLLVAQRIFAARPRRHIDVGSRIDGFVAHVASFRPVEVVDLRPLQSTVPNVSFLQADAMSPGGLGLSLCDSVSCLHVLEHFGLGRYGDPLDVYGYAKGFANLVQMLEPGGTMYLSVPIGPQMVLFNAHRRFFATTILELADDSLELRRFDYVDDAGDLHRDVALDYPRKEPALGCSREGCGIFEFVKRT